LGFVQNEPFRFSQYLFISQICKLSPEELADLEERVPPAKRQKASQMSNNGPRVLPIHPEDEEISQVRVKAYRCPCIVSFMVFLACHFRLRFCVLYCDTEGQRVSRSGPGRKTNVDARRATSGARRCSRHSLSTTARSMINDTLKGERDRIIYKRRRHITY
jgi:hypothetical protein